MPADLERVTRNVDIVEAILQGKSAQEVGAEYGITDRQVYRILKDDDYKAILEQGQREQIALVPKAGKALSGLIDSKDEGIRLKAVAQVHKNVGISPTHAQSVYINNLYQTANVVVGGPAQDALRKALGMQLGLDADCVDVTPEAESDADSDD